MTAQNDRVKQWMDAMSRGNFPYGEGGELFLVVCVAVVVGTVVYFLSP